MAVASQFQRDTVACSKLNLGGSTVPAFSAVNETIIACRMWGVGAAGACYVVSPIAGKVIDARIQLDGAISGNDPQFNLRDAHGTAASQLVVDSSAQSEGDTHAWTLASDLYVGHGTPLSCNWNGNTTGNVDGTLWIRVEYEGPQDFYFVSLGNSNCRDATEGYDELGGLNHWPILSIFNNGGGLVKDWARAISNKYGIYRACFEYAVRRYGCPKVLWWNLYCDDDGGTRTDGTVRQADIDDMEAVIAFFDLHCPGMTVYVSDPNEYDGITCSSIGTWGNIAAGAMVQWLIDNKGYLRGPTIPALNSGNAAGDDCHPSEAEGHQEQGERLRRFFDGGGVVNGN